MQLRLKSLEKFTTTECDMNTLVKEVSRLEIAGVKSCLRKKDTGDINAIQRDEACASVEVDNSVYSRLERIEELLASGNDDSVNQVQRREYSTSRKQFKRSNSKTTEGARKCRNCGSEQHMVRKCPTRFCQACGERGHDTWDKTCQKHC